MIGLSFYVLLFMFPVVEGFNHTWDVRLAGGPYENEGRLEIRPPGGEWGTVCDRKGADSIVNFCYLEEDMCHRLGYLDSLRLSGGCSAREGRVEVDLGAAGWAVLKRGSYLSVSLTDADMVCENLGYPLALASGNPCKTKNNHQDGDILNVMAGSCNQKDGSISECLRKSVRRCPGNEQSDEAFYGDWEVVCANDDDVIATNVTNLIDSFDIRLINGTSHFAGILELRHNTSGWAPACFFDEQNRQEISEKVCYELGQNCVVDTNLIAEQNYHGLEYIFRYDIHENVHWLRGENHCRRQGGYNLEIYCTVDISYNGETVHISPEQTCIGRCGDMPIKYKCGCDVMCHMFHDCCYDFGSVCPTPSSFDNESQQDPNFGGLLKSSEYYECLPLGSRGPTHQLVSICPDTWQDDAIKYHCESPLYSQPVLYLPLNIFFKNIMCAHCHDVTPSLNMALNLSEANNATLDSQKVAYETLLVPIWESGLNMPRPCTNLVSSCLSHTTEDLREACDAYMAPHMLFKNPHCALCNGITKESLLICWMFAPPPIWPDRTDIGISHSMLVGPSNEVTRDYHVISLDVEVSCWQKQSILEIAILNSHNYYEEHLSGPGSMKCLVYAVAYSNLSLALHFSSSLHSLLDSESDRNSSEVYRPTVSITSSTLPNISDFEEILDAILRFDGDLSKPDWGHRCRLTNVSLSDECLVTPIQSTETSNLKNIECFDIAEGTLITMNISGELYVYIINGGVLIAPVNISTITAYDVRTENVSKTKIIHFCGEQEQILTCKTLEDFDSVYSKDIPDPESRAILPNGQTIVCFSKAQLESFSTPEQILNLVCFSLSIAGLTATLLTYSVFSTLRNAHGLAVMSLSLAILFAQLLSILSKVVVNLSIRSLCSVVAVITHYMWLSAFAWMAIISWDFMRTFTGISSAKTHGSYCKFRRLCLFGWCSPLLVIIPNLVLHFCHCTSVDFSYGSEVNCWIASSEAIFVVFCAPIILCVCFNIACFAWTIKGIRASQKASAIVKKHKSNVKEVWHELAIYAKMSSLMSFSWIVGFVAMATDHVIVWFLFTIFSSLQGVFIFISFAFTRRVRALWRDKLIRKEQSSAATASTQKSTLDSKVITSSETKV